MNSKPLSTKLPINRPSSGFQVPYNLSDEYILENEIDSNYFDIFRGILKNKRESKKLRKIHEEIEKDSWRNVWDICIFTWLCRYKENQRIL